ncbi:ABC transporter ATP-binding protein [Streptomyces sp. NPDC050529]|uniref:ABC transporter ATP-binding protein n=1 Tax=Streptomyces sp. NPDC050529 TaxID=3365624 RepID=UPI0037A65A19
MAAGGAATVVALACGRFGTGLLLQPFVSLGAAAAATTIVIRRALRRSRKGRPEQHDGRGRHPLGQIVGPHKRRFAWATLLSATGQMAETSTFAIFSYTLMVLVQGNSGLLAQWGLVGLAAQLPVLAAAVALACAATAGLEYGAGIAWRRLGQSVEHDWRTRTYAHVQQLSPADLEGEHTSRITAVLTEDVSRMGTFVSSSMHQSVQLATSFAVLLPVFTLLVPQLAWLAFAPIPLMTWLSFRYHERSKAALAVSGERRGRMRSRMSDNLQANSTVKAFCSEGYEAAHITELSQGYADATERTDRSMVLQALVVRASAMTMLPATLFLGGKAVLKGSLSVGAVAPLIEMPAQALKRLTLLGGITDQYQQARGALANVQRLHELPVESGTNSLSLDHGSVTGEIELKNVTFAYPGRPATLEKMSLRIAPGEVTGIVGATGAGKTTVAKLLMRFRRPDSGDVLLDGRNVEDLALSDLRGVIGYVSQDPFLFDATIADNIRYGTFSADDERLADAARTAGADTFISEFPDGYHTMVGERGSALSGGQRQRIALARTILKNPPIVILDEATSAVDNGTEAAIQRALNAFGKNRTMVVIAHRLSTIRNADRIVVLDQGGVVKEQGTHHELVQSDGMYATMWGLQAGEKVPGARHE